MSTGRVVLELDLNKSGLFACTKTVNSVTALGTMRAVSSNDLTVAVIVSLSELRASNFVRMSCRCCSNALKAVVYSIS